MRGRKLSDLVGCLILVLLVVVLAMVVFPRDTYADVRSTVLTAEVPEKITPTPSPTATPTPVVKKSSSGSGGGSSTPVTKSSGTAVARSQNAKTSDNTNLNLWVSPLLLTGIITVFLYKKQRNRK